MYWYNGQLIQEEKLTPPPTSNRSFKYGDGLFESIRIYRGQPLFLTDHWERLLDGMQRMQLTYPEDWVPMLSYGLQEVLKAKGLQGNARARVHVYRGGEGAYRPTSNQINYLIEAEALVEDTYLAHVPVTLTTYRDWPLFTHPLTGCKTANGLPYIMAALDAKSRGFDEAVLFHQDGQLAEASSANIFYIYQRKIYTPPLTSGCLNGIMRKQVFELAEQIKLPVQERKSRAKDLIQADEVFLTNTIRGLIPVSRFENRLYPTEYRVLTAFLQKCLRQLVQA